MRYTIKDIHRLGAYVLGVFVALHIINHLTAVVGPQAHISTMAVMRKFYRNMLIEPLILLAVGMIIPTGLTLVYKKRRALTQLLPAIQAGSGIYLAFFLVNHVRAVLIARIVWKVDTDFYFAANVAASPDTRGFFVPYYSLSVICVFVHLACAHYSRTLPVSGAKKARREAILIALAGGITCCLIIAAISGLLYRF